MWKLIDKRVQWKGSRENKECQGCHRQRSTGWPELTRAEMANPHGAAAQAWGCTTPGHKLAHAEPAWVISPWSKIKLQPSLSTHRQRRVGYRFFGKYNHEKKRQNPQEMHPSGFLHSWVKQRLPSLSFPHYKWKAKNGNLDRILKCHSSANHTFFQVWKIRPSFSKRQLQILIAWLLVVLVIYLKIIFQVPLEWLGFFRMCSVSFGSGLYTKTRNVDVHGYTDNKWEK